MEDGTLLVTDSTPWQKALNSRKQCGIKGKCIAWSLDRMISTNIYSKACCQDCIQFWIHIYIKRSRQNFPSNDQEAVHTELPFSLQTIEGILCPIQRSIVGKVSPSLSPEEV